MQRFRYVVLRHEDYGDPHFDLMFETAAGSMLSTWRSPNWPVEDGNPLIHLPIHRAVYLEFAGPLAGGRGHVARIHAGQHCIRQNDATLLITVLENGTTLSLPKADHLASALGA